MTAADDGDFVEEVTAAMVEARKLGQADGITALRQLRARLELVDPPTVHATSAVEAAAFRAGHHDAIQGARAEAATVLAQLTRVAADTHPPKEHP